MQKITPFLWFDTQAREAAEFYVSVFGEDSAVLAPAKLDNTPSGSVEVIPVKLLDQTFTFMSAGPVFKFNEAISFVIDCDGQEEVDYYWDALSAVPEAEQCGWLKDRFGVSWQVVPKQLHECIGGPDAEGRKRAMQAMLKMKKLDVAELQKAYAGG